MLIETGKTVILCTSSIYNFSEVQRFKLVTTTMYNRKFCQHITERKGILIYSLCSLIFILHITLIGLYQANPEQTVPSKMALKLHEMEKFPVVFKLCIKPGGFDLDKLNRFGYQTAKHYFSGLSMYNDSVIGWAGHNKDGSVNSTAAGHTLVFYNALFTFHLKLYTLEVF